MHASLLHGVLGGVLGVAASVPAQDLVVTLSIAALFGVGCGITGFIFSQIEGSA